MHPPPAPRTADRELRRAWAHRFAGLSPAARATLVRAQHARARHKAPMALYWKVVGVYAGHLARAVEPPAPASRPRPNPRHDEPLGRRR